LEAFEASPAPGIWPYIKKQDIIQDLRDTIANPLQVNQGYSPLCGPAAIVYELVQRDPAYFVQICQNLYETGQFTARSGQVIQPSPNLVQSRVRTSISIADWMLLASLRDSENLIFRVDATASDFVTGISTPWEVKGWTIDLLGFSNVDFRPVLFYGEFEAMQQAQQIHDQGGVAFLLINATMLGLPKPPIPYPDHWIGFLGNLEIDDQVWDRRKYGHIHFDCYTWGERKRVDIDEKTFETYFFGMVTGMPRQDPG
jgi:hypothetical protein